MTGMPTSEIIIANVRAQRDRAREALLYYHDWATDVVHSEGVHLVELHTTALKEANEASGKYDRQPDGFKPLPPPTKAENDAYHDQRRRGQTNQ